jgi:hypothetical protein
LSPTPWRITLTLAAGLALAACNSSQRQEREQVEQQLAAVEKELAALRSSLQALEKERAALTTAVSEAESHHSEALTTLHRTQAAAAYLAELDPSPLTMSEELRMAREGWQLEEAVKGGDRQAVESAATLALRWQLPCEDQGGGEDESLSCEDFADACASVNKHLAPEPRWECSLVPPAAEGESPAAFCVDTYEHPAPVGMEDSPYSVDDLPTTVSVARVATLENGELSALDYPSPDPRLYNPPNARERAQCALANQRSQCLVDCDKAHNRYTSPCAEDYYQEPAEEGDEEEEVEEVDEEEQERQEAGFRECVAACESENEAALEAVNEPKGRASVSLRLESSPVPGIFLVTRQEKVLEAGGKVQREDSSVLVLRRPDSSPSLDGLQEVARLQEVPRKGQSLELVQLPGVEGPALVGLSKGKAAGYTFTPKGAASPLTQETVCKAVRAEPKRWPAALVAACGPEPEAAPVQEDSTEPRQAGEDKAVVGEETP